MSKSKRVNKPKEEIASDMKLKQEAQRKRKFVGEVLFPLLQEHTKTIREAKMFCRVVQNDILTTFNAGMKAPLSTLKIEEKFADSDTEGPRAVKALVRAFKDVPINETIELLDGMPNAIDAAINHDGSSYLLADLSFNDGTFTTKKSFEYLIKDTPECNDFRQLGSEEWMAYSTVVDKTGKGLFMAKGDTIIDALFNLRKLLREN